MYMPPSPAVRARLRPLVGRAEQKHVRSVVRISCVFLRPRPWQFEI